MDEEQFNQVMADIRSLKEGQKALKNEIELLHRLSAADVELILSLIHI